MTERADDERVWRLDWLTPMRCRLLLALLLAAGFVSHVIYLQAPCPIDLSGDEAQYWDWSRQLDLSYYSKGPAVAYIIRASCAIFGDTMQAVRYPAILFGTLTSIVVYLLTKKLFGSEKLALGTVALFCVVPMFVAGSVLMTIDPPMFFCWALATYLATNAVFDRKPRLWALVGIVIGLGFLAKYAEFLWFVGAAGWIVAQGRGLRTIEDLTAAPSQREKRPEGSVSENRARMFWIAPLIAGLFTLPVLIWNARHGWVSFRHVAHQTGTSQGSFSLFNPLEMIAGQAAAIGPTIALLMIAAIVYAIRTRDDPHRAKLLWLLWIGGTFFAFNLLASLRAKVQVNWPAPAYFTLMIITAYFLSTRLQTLRTWKPWRGWFYASVIIGIVVIPIAHDSALLLRGLRPIVDRINASRLAQHKPARVELGSLDPLARLRGWNLLGQSVSEELTTLAPGAFVLCDDYQQTAAAAFYVKGHPKTYCAGSYFDDPKRLSQYDVWPDRSIGVDTALVGKDAVYVGKGGGLPHEIEAAFECTERLPPIDIVVEGAVVRSFKLWRCYGFKGMTRKSRATAY